MDVTVRKRMVAEKRQRVLLKKYESYEFPEMPPPATLVLDGHVMFPVPSISSPMMIVSSGPKTAALLPTENPRKAHSAHRG